MIALRVAYGDHVTLAHLDETFGVVTKLLEVAFRQFRFERKHLKGRDLILEFAIHRRHGALGRLQDALARVFARPRISAEDDESGKNQNRKRRARDEERQPEVERP